MRKPVSTSNRRVAAFDSDGSERIDLAKATFDPQLPITAHRQRIIEAVSANQVVIVCGETGSGKSTQLPKMLLHAGCGRRGMIGQTQPRRLAARSVAQRIAAELDVAPGREVGYSVRFSDVTSPHTVIRIMTDGVLLAETSRDRLFRRYDALIIDEAHERSLNIDFLMGYLKSILTQRADLKVVLTSATIDPQRLSEFFSHAPVIEVGGRAYPVEVRYRPAIDSIDLDEDDPVILEAIHQAVIETGTNALPNAPDALVFLSGEREIREAARYLTDRLPPDHEILPLYARLSAAEQNRIFKPHAGRRIVLSTNVAETSLTVPGIGSVIDAGLARVSRYSATGRVQRLPVEKISQASARQRAGRCGRIAPGVCIRLYSEEDFLDRPEFTDPEILRSNLARVILQMKALNLGTIEQFPFIDRPRGAGIRAGMQTLHELHAIDSREQLTAAGHKLARLPIDPRFGRMVLESGKQGAVREVLIIVAALAAQDPRLRPLDRASLADASHAEFADERSDFLSLLKLWEWWRNESASRTSSAMRRLCESRFLSWLRFREWVDTHRQLHALAMAAGLRSNTTPAGYEGIHKSLLTGLLSNVGQRTDASDYLGVSERRFAIFPGSSLFRQQPRWIMAAEIVETTRLFARTVARIHPVWIEELAAHLVKRTHTAPFWNRASGHVEAHERVMLRGMTLVPKRRVHFGRIDLPLARETFIRHALVEADYESPPARSRAPGRSQHDDSLKANRQRIATLRDLEHKVRRRDVLVSPETIHDLYDRRLPLHVCNGPAFEKWRRREERKNPDILRFRDSELIRAGAAPVDAASYPSTLELPGLSLALEYRHEPGHPEDGITAIVPVEAVERVSGERCEWLVPGMLREKVAALIKTLPKHLRTNFVPAAAVAETVAQHMTFGVGVLTDAIARELDRSTGVLVPRDAWRIDQLPEHLRLNFKIVDAAGNSIACGRDLATIRRSLDRSAITPPNHDAESRFMRTGLTHWGFDDLPREIAIHRHGSEITLHPAVVDEGDSVGVRLCPTQDRADSQWRSGLRRLFLLQIRDELRMHVDYLPSIDDMTLLFTSMGHSATLLRDQFMLLVTDRVFLREDAEVRTEAEFNRRLEAGWNQLWSTTSVVAELVADILRKRHEVDLRIEGAATNAFLQSATDDMKLQLRLLMPSEFLTQTPWKWLIEFPRYLDAVQSRLLRLADGGLSRDQESQITVQRLWKDYKVLADDPAYTDAHTNLAEVRWLLEELRVSLFAPGVPTAVRVSPQRLESLLDAARRSSKSH